MKPSVATSILSLKESNGNWYAKLAMMFFPEARRCSASPMSSTAALGNRVASGSLAPAGVSNSSSNSGRSASSSLRERTKSDWDCAAWSHTWLLKSIPRHSLARPFSIVLCAALLTMSCSTLTMSSAAWLSSSDLSFLAGTSAERNSSKAVASASGLLCSGSVLSALTLAMQPVNRWPTSAIRSGFGNERSTARWRLLAAPEVGRQ
mmetsp:Transcript_66410/g.172310  ORF Transcript_66410/g.172310 Transcript_66410/m.172310 type:complete len:206 (-) Transcript_66410:16-633(-)